MAHSTITLIIIAATCVLYIIDKLPVALVTALGMLAMIFSGATTSRTAFSNFGSTPVLLTFGMIIIINAIIDSGAIVQFEHVLRRMTCREEKLFLVLMFLSAGIISMFPNNSAPVAMSILAVVALCYWFFLYDLSVKWLDFEEVADDGKPIAEIPLNKRNAIISLAVFVIPVALFIIQPFKWDLGLIAVSGATIVIALGCVDGKRELRNMMCRRSSPWARHWPLPTALCSPGLGRS